MGDERAREVEIRDEAAAARDVERRPWLSLGAFARRRKRWLLGLTALAIAGSVYALRRKPQSDHASPGAWKGRIAASLSGGQGGVLVLDPAGGAPHLLAPGETIPKGAHLRTDLRTWARLRFDDGTTLVADRNGDVALDAATDRAATLASGTYVLEVTPQKDAPARVKIPGAELTTDDGKLAISVDVENGVSQATVVVARGAAVLTTDDGQKVTALAGEAAGLHDGKLALQPACDMGGAFLLAERDELELAPEGDSANVPGVGELRARKPGSAGQGDRSLALTRQRVHVRIEGDVARTEIDETFASDLDEELEGVFRFPLPPNAEIERLALDVDGTMQEGAFVEKEKGTAIWKGVIFDATPKPPSLHEDQVVWVQGPWHDPALLEWRAGGRMELRIFPIPKKGARRVVLAYTQKVPLTAGTRRYSYPLPHLPDGRVSIGDFAIDVAVGGHDEARGVRVKGYEADASGATRTIARKAFVPTGDVVVEYALAADEQPSGLAATAFRPVFGGDPYVSLTLRPELPRAVDDRARTEIIVVDASRSMVGERWLRATSLAARMIEELDPRDRFVLLACDATCSSFSDAPLAPAKDVPAKVRDFFAARSPDGATDVVRSIESGVAIARGDGSARALRVLYLGDGSPSIGALAPAELELGVKNALALAGDDATLTAVQIGIDADRASLDAIARGGAGTVVPYVAGEKVGATALAALGAAYGDGLRDVSITLPSGLIEVAPARLPAVGASSELALAARMSGDAVHGDVVLAGTIAGKRWTHTWRLDLDADSSPEHAWVPRTFATATLADLERSVETTAVRARGIELSKSFSVPSRWTSLLVLESPAMAAAFGVERRSPVATWLGDAAAPSNDGKVAPAVIAPGATMIAVESAAAAPNATEGARPKDDRPCAWLRPSFEYAPRWASRGTLNHWYCAPTLQLDGRLPAGLANEIERAEEAVKQAPDERARHAALFAVLAPLDSTAEAQRALLRWTDRDPFDADAILRRSELVARDGERDRALRIALGALDARPDDFGLADGLADVALRAGDPRLACALLAVHASLVPTDAKAVAKRLACAKDTASPPSKTASVTGVELDATWSGDVDLDVALIAPSGARLSWASPIGVRAIDATKLGHENLVVTATPEGRYAIEITRAKKTDGPPVTGTLILRVPGAAEQKYPFTLAGVRTRIAFFDLTWKEQWVAIILIHPPMPMNDKIWIDDF